MTLPKEFPVGAGELTIVGTGGLTFEEKRDIIVYDNRHVVLVQTSASSYRPGDKMEVRVVVTNEELMPVENGEVNIEIYVCVHDFSSEHHRSLFDLRMPILNSLVNSPLFQFALVRDSITNTCSYFIGCIDRF